MSNHKNRLAQLEKRRNKQPNNTPQVIEIYGARMDGTQYLAERRELKDGFFVTVYKHSTNEVNQNEHTR